MINLRSFEEESKTQAEREYDDTYGPLQDLPDSSSDPKKRSLLKKRRKVRSAIVSRRKSALYEKKLEDELHLRTKVNDQLRDKLQNYSVTLAGIQQKINILQNNVPTRFSTPASTTITTATTNHTFTSTTPTSPPPPPIISLHQSFHHTHKPLPSISALHAPPRPLPPAKYIALPRFHEPRETSQVTFSTNHSP
ncbi:unnamed protein product [Agarophyton chilense]